MHTEILQPKATLTWSDARPPNGESHYNHMIAQYPFGHYMIEWREWQPHTGYDLFLNFNKIDTFPTLEDAQLHAMAHLSMVAKQLQAYCVE